MPSKSVRSFKTSGMQKVAVAASAANGGIAAQGLKEDFNSTYPSNTVDMDVADSAPFNQEYAMRLPDKPTPLHDVSLSEVSLGGKK